MKVPIISRLNFRDYQALVIGLFFLFLERSVRLITYCFPNFVLEYLKSLSQKLYSMKHEDTRTDPAKIIQFSTTFREMVEYWEYSMEEHIVKTRDDYLLGIHRIPTGKFSDDDDDKLAESHIKSVFNNCGIPLSAIRTKYPRSSTKETKETKEKKPVVLLYHGLMMCSEIWMCNMEEERQLPFLLADAGYDVWFGNARGNKYSMKHTRYKPNEGQFWEYSMDEFALFDLPDTIDYILETTGVPSLTYIGFSQGTAQSFAALSINPSLNNKVNLFIALAPATSPVGLQNPIVDAFIKASPNIVYLFFGRKAFLTMAMFWQKVLSPPIYTELLDRCMKLLFGWDGNNMTKEQKSVSYFHLYSFTSVKSLVHWFQIIRARKFQMYDELPPYSSSTAMGYYCHEFPTRQIKTPIGVFYGGSDSLVDIRVLLKQLPKPVFTKEVQPYEHLDFLWASDVHKTVFPELFDLLSKYNNVRHKIDDEINNDYQHINDKEFN